MRIAIRVGARDAVHDAGAAYFAALSSTLDDDSPLPDATDRTAQHRFQARTIAPILGADELAGLLSSW